MRPWNPGTSNWLSGGPIEHVEVNNPALGGGLAKRQVLQRTVGCSVDGIPVDLHPFSHGLEAAPRIQAEWFLPESGPRPAASFHPCSPR